MGSELWSLAQGKEAAKARPKQRAKPTRRHPGARWGARPHPEPSAKCSLESPQEEIGRT